MREKKKNNESNDIMDENMNQQKQDTAQAEEQNVENADHAAKAAVEESEPDLHLELEAAKDKYVRLYAEFDNYKRRTGKERVALIQSAGKDVISSLLPILDDFDRALKAMEQAAEVASIKEGMLLVSQKLQKTLEQQGLKEMESVGKPFDADLQEAITSIPAPNEKMKGQVIDEIEKGYFLNDQVLRHAKVVVGN